MENLLAAWRDFISGKENRKDVQEFKLFLYSNIKSLHNDLVARIYKHGSYHHFKISDPKPRDIHKATVRDRLLHHAICRVLYPYFDKTFICDSYSCRNKKGTHKAFNKFRSFAWQASSNHMRTVWVLKCDIRKFFASIDQKILIQILGHYIRGENIMWLLSKVISSFNSGNEGVGLPLGNLTSQLFVNIYMNGFDQFIKHTLKLRYYIRYADDFVILDADRDRLKIVLEEINEYLLYELHLKLHPNKVFIKTFASGIDFLGWVHFPDHRVLRTSTKRRAVRALDEGDNIARLSSYCGLLGHGNQYGLKELFQIRIDELIEIN